jgi:hypothetical protein
LAFSPYPLLYITQEERTFHNRSEEGSGSVRSGEEGEDSDLEIEEDGETSDMEDVDINGGDTGCEAMAVVDESTSLLTQIR